MQIAVECRVTRSRWTNNAELHIKKCQIASKNASKIDLILSALMGENLS